MALKILLLKNATYLENRRRPLFHEIRNRQQMVQKQFSKSISFRIEIAPYYTTGYFRDSSRHTDCFRSYHTAFWESAF